ncbi:rRNA biogenesis protein rrp36-like isoform X1 [Dioscorea cayenensis subsp. rotundata]|uniref:rRNA biogenesis protein RRP36 n=2 Tax=Dioscorea cayennensis subsp. rotundata TaxID=55577 RepID=A0AB40AIY6_DIOCR|nr:rRNA biogenesis protein rrp36-like isoform X1 [Dioscorea cayenensis subsp. rotundata]XP_039114736.1 rRNA biogenesis protein rrp36-like isoform X1 [Dioscorea cayenensis subsp. rotundata]XP_039114738.1 rRNA biogenesis protein rrp36-like isoform X1 [Dioscorea cayenensis subsp. rotundata]
MVKEKKLQSSNVQRESTTAMEDDDLMASPKEEEEIERVLADIPLGELQKVRADGSHAPRSKAPIKRQQKLGRAHKNMPMEMSSKVPAGKFREVIQVPKKVTRDPRFESLCGTLDRNGFHKRYDFLFQVELPAEKEKLHKLIKKERDPTVIKELKEHLCWIDKQLQSAQQKKVGSRVLSEHIKKEKEAAKQGKRPYYLKKSEIRQGELVKKYEDLKAAGKLDSFIEKRRKRNALKDIRYMPYRRTNKDV